jgi:hypothetical protein
MLFLRSYLYFTLYISLAWNGLALRTADNCTPEKARKIQKWAAEAKFLYLRGGKVLEDIIKDFENDKHNPKEMPVWAQDHIAAIFGVDSDINDWKKYHSKRISKSPMLD